MRVGERIAERRTALGISQSELARRARLSQGTIGKLEAGISSGSSHLHRIARELGTTPAYLEGETDDPGEGALPPPSVPDLQHIMMPVALPSEETLARMFEGLLAVVDLEARPDELARELAQLLPTALSQARGRATDPLATPPLRQRAAPAEALATAGHERQR